MKVLKRSSSVKIIKKVMCQRILLLAAVIAVSLLAVGLTSLSPIVYKVLIDDFIPNRSINQVFFYILILILIPVVVVGTAHFRDWLIYRLSDSVSEELRRRAYRSCLFMLYSEFEKIGYQKAVKVITREIGQICDMFIFGELLTVINSFLQLVFTYLILMTLNWKLASVCLVIVPVLFLVVNKSRGSVGGAEARLMKLLTKCDNYLTHALVGIKAVKSANAQSYEMEEFDNWLEENRIVNWEIKRSHSFSRTILPNIAQQITFGLILVMCACFVMTGQITMGTLLAAISYIPILFSAVSSLFGTKIGYEAVKNSIHNLDEVLDSKQECGAIKEAGKNRYPFAIELSDFQFAYSRDSFGVHIDGLSVKDGEAIAIVGESGSGKSAIFDVLGGFYKTYEGSARLFGKEIQDIDPASLRKIVGLCSQNVVLWNKTIEENIIYPSRLEDKDDEKYERSVRQAGLASFLQSLPEGDKTVLGDFGSQISGGEKQRIALARTFYSDHDILLLDEPTSALDSIHAQLIFETLLSKRQDCKTIVIVTHDILKAMKADRIAVMKEGKIIEIGSPDELLAKGAQFQKLYASFADEMRKEPFDRAASSARADRP